MADSFYIPLGDGRWRATVHTTGPWDARAQHAGPPSALLGRAVQECEPRADMMIARKTVPDRLVSFLKVVQIHSERDIDRAFRCR